MMKKFCLSVIFTALLVISAGAQSTLSGKVVEVIDGKTVIVEIAGRKITAELQFIEVPEPEQPLNATVREHLQKLTLDKVVTFRSAGFAPGKAFGQLYIDSGDVAIQMLRDGAAWHISPEKSGQKAADSDEYQYHQTQARLEQRGVWGVKGMMPAWQYRADKIERAKRAQIAADQAAAKSGQAKFAPVTAAKAPVRRSGAWPDVNPSLRDPGPLMHGYNAAARSGYVGTSLMGVKELESVPAGQKVACDVTYFYKQETEKRRTGTFVLTLVSMADEWRFDKANGVTVSVDEKNVMAAKPKRTAAREDGKAVERLTYEVNKATIEKIVYGGEVTIKIGNYTLYLGPGLQLLLYNMLQVAE